MGRPPFTIQLPSDRDSGRDSGRVSGRVSDRDSDRVSGSPTIGSGIIPGFIRKLNYYHGRNLIALPPTEKITELYTTLTSSTVEKIGNSNSLQLDGSKFNMIGTTDKVKQGFTLCSGNSQPLPIKLKFYKSDNTVSPQFLKTFIMNKSVADAAYGEQLQGIDCFLIKILAEVYFQQLAYNVSQIKSNKTIFKVPKVIKHGYFFLEDNEDTKNVVFYILMDYVEGVTFNKLRNPYCSSVSEKLIGINEILQNNHIYHNDLKTPDNTIIQEDGIITIIDFGEATSEPTKLLNFPKCQDKVASPTTPSNPTTRSNPTTPSKKQTRSYRPRSYRTRRRLRTRRRQIQSVKTPRRPIKPRSKRQTRSKR